MCRFLHPSDRVCSFLKTTLKVFKCPALPRTAGVSRLFTLSCSPQVSQSTGYFELQLISVENPKGQLLNGECCDAESSAAEGHCGADECDTYFRVCLKEYQTEVTTNGPCTYGSETTKVIGGNTFQFRGSQKTGQNRNSDSGKIIIPFQFSWPVSGCLNVFIYCVYNLYLRGNI